MGVISPQFVQLLANFPGHDPQVPGVDTHRTQFRARHLNGGFHPLGDVVRVHQQRGVGAVGFHLGPECRLLVGGAVIIDVQQGPGVGGGAGAGNPIPVDRLQVRSRGEPGQVGGPGGRDRGQFIGAPGTHFDDGAAVSGGNHAGGSRCYRGIRVEDGQDQGL